MGTAARWDSVRPMVGPQVRDASEFHGVIDVLFTLLSSDPTSGPRLRDAIVPTRFHVKDLPGEHVSAWPLPDATEAPFLAWSWSTTDGPPPAVEVTATTTTLLRFFQGAENVVGAYLRGRIRIVGDRTQLTSLYGSVKPMFDPFREALRASGYDHLVAEPA